MQCSKGLRMRCLEIRKVLNKMRFTTYLETIEEITLIAILLATNNLISVLIVTRLLLLLDWMYNLQVYIVTHYINGLS